MPAETRMPAETLADLLAGAAAAGSGGLRFVGRDEEATFLGWDEVRRRAERARSWLVARGVRPGDRVGTVFRTAPGFFDAFFGLLAAGAVPVPLYPPVRLGRLGEYHRRTAAMLAAAGARLLVAEPLAARLLGEVVALGRGALELAVLDGLPQPAAGSPPAAPAADDLALVQFSSGTTVEPKPVALSHRAILAQVAALNRHWRHVPGASGVSWLPLYHDMGLIGCVFPALDVAAELTLIPPELFVARPALWLRTLSRYRGMVSPAPNFAYGLCLEKIADDELEGVDLSSWRVALNGAETVSAEVMRRFNRRFAPWGLEPRALTPVYGLSEASLAVTFSDLDRPFTSERFDAEALATSGRALPAPGGTELVSVGRPLPGFAVEIRDAAGAALPAAHAGRVWVRGPSLMSGYLGLPDATREVLVDGWLDTGDTGFLYAEELYLTGRAKDVLILRGRNHPPEEVERALDGLAGVRTGCAAAVSYRPPEAASDALLVFVESRPAPGLGPAALAAACRRRILAATGLAADRVLVLAPGTLPRTSSGKIRRREALRRFLDGELDPPRRVGWWRLLWAMIRSRRALARAGE
ncbi:MAG: AMP-binding protein [Acidobacteriota bacterium]|nr:AMP-binding protein [Acidobacteriota bacterium]MDH3524807.1 AMP-binding protein [Acidobacteriota bacterium]